MRWRQRLTTALPRESSAADLRERAENCASGDFYAVRPMVSENGLSDVTQRYETFETTERNRRNRC